MASSWEGALSDSARLPTAAIQPLPAVNQPADPNLIAIGERLFSDARFSGKQQMSCASCHVVESGGDDGRSYSDDGFGRPRAIHTPTVLNIRHNYIVGWTGKFGSVKELSDAVLCSEKAVGSDWDTVLAVVRADPVYASLFANLPGGEISRETLLEALVGYQSSLTTPESPVDRYLKGEEEAISDESVDGYHLFQSYGCIACHQGRNIGGNMFQKFGLFGSYYTDNDREQTPVDLGRFNVTGVEEDRHVFRVPSLRNVSETAPYFHDGRVATLEEAVRLMVKHQLGREISQAEVLAIVSFLGDLSGSPGEDER